MDDKLDFILGILRANELHQEECQVIKFRNSMPSSLLSYEDIALPELEFPECNCWLSQ